MAWREGMRVMAGTWLQGMVHSPRRTDEKLVESILQMFERRTPDLFALQIKALLERPDATSVLATLELPALVLCGREDTWAPPSRHDAMAKMIRRSTLEVIPDCGHMSTLERPQAVNQAFRRWLQSIEGWT
jgi:pimeloyl-ACP methyl ester carboxylesterase